MFTPLEILYIVLAFCVLWLSAATFWLIWQVANILKSMNTFIDDARETLEKIEASIRAIKERVEKMTSATGIVIDGIKTAVDYAMDKKKKGTDTSKDT